MYSTDRDSFEQLLTRLSTAFSKPITDEIRGTYWEALKDLPVGTVVRQAEMHMRYGKFFPKPVELRPKEERPKEKDAAIERQFREVVALSSVHLDELWGTNRDLWLRTVSPKVYELGRAKGLPDTYIAEKLRTYQPARQSG